MLKREQTSCQLSNRYCLYSGIVLTYLVSEQENSSAEGVGHRRKWKENKRCLESMGTYFILMHRVF